MTAEAGAQALPVIPHIAGEFYAWLWFTSEANDALFRLGGDVGNIELWVDERLAFRLPTENKVSAVVTGENSSTSLESRAALAGGKVLQELRVGIRRDDREFLVTLKGPEMHLAQVKLPQVMAEGEDEVLYDRMFLYEELCFVLSQLVRQFSNRRSSPDWSAEVLPELRRWVMGLH